MNGRIRLERTITGALVFAMAVLIMIVASPARAAVIGYYTAEGVGRLELHNEPGHCIGGSMMAEIVTAEGERLPRGCWSAHAEMVLVTFPWYPGIAMVRASSIKQATAL